MAPCLPDADASGDKTASASERTHPPGRVINAFLRMFFDGGGFFTWLLQLKKSPRPGLRLHSEGHTPVSFPPSRSYCRRENVFAS